MVGGRDQYIFFFSIISQVPSKIPGILNKFMNVLREYDLE